MALGVTSSIVRTQREWVTIAGTRWLLGCPALRGGRREMMPEGGGGGVTRVSQPRSDLGCKSADVRSVDLGLVVEV